MKPGLQRIEATLDQLGTQPGDSQPLETQPMAEGIPISGLEDRQIVSSGTAPKVGIASNPVQKPAVIMQPQGKPVTIKPFPLPKPDAQNSSPGTSSAISVPPGQAGSTETTPTPLPEVNSPASAATGVTSSRPAANPNLAIGLLKEVETIVRGWQRELEQVVQQIQTLYQEGPIVDGWLESHAINSSQSMAPGVSVLRHAEIEHLMEYVEQICRTGQSHPIDGALRTDYRLCGLDADGKLWSRPCPTEQVPYVSLAIARYQKLRTLLEKKHSLETRLTSLVETLTVLHGQMRS